MADEQEKTEEATPKKIEDARKKGNVPKSQDTSSIITLFIATGLIFLLFGFISKEMLLTTRGFFSQIGTPIDELFAINSAIVTFKEIFLMIMPVLIGIGIAGVIANVIQFGFLWTTEPLVPKLEKIDPVKGFKNLFSIKKIIDGIKIMFKSFVTMFVGFLFFISFIKELPTVIMFDIKNQLVWLAQKSVILALVILLVLFVFAIIDLIITRRRYFESLKMSKQEVKDERKNMEGDPLIKSKIRQKQMEMAQKRMMSNVPEADVVITNPTHYAVALKYDQKKNPAPVVVAKGVNHTALKIKEIARKHNVHIVENPPLARTLYAEVELEKPIPESMFSAVAEILAYVYKLNKNKN